MALVNDSDVYYDRPVRHRGRARRRHADAGHRDASRHPRWDVGYDDIELATTSTDRGWESMPITVR